MLKPNLQIIREKYSSYNKRKLRNTEMHQQSRLPYSVTKQNTVFGGMCEFGFGSPSKIGSIYVLQGFVGTFRQLLHQRALLPNYCVQAKWLQYFKIAVYRCRMMHLRLQPALQYYNQLFNTSILQYIDAEECGLLCLLLPSRQCRRMWFVNPYIHRSILKLNP